MQLVTLMNINYRDNFISLALSLMVIFLHAILSIQMNPAPGSTSLLFVYCCPLFKNKLEYASLYYRPYNFSFINFYLELIVAWYNACMGVA